MGGLIGRLGTRRTVRAGLLRRSLLRLRLAARTRLRHGKSRKLIELRLQQIPPARRIEGGARGLAGLRGSGVAIARKDGSTEFTLDYEGLG